MDTVKIWFSFRDRDHPVSSRRRSMNALSNAVTLASLDVLLSSADLSVLKHSLVL